MSRAIFLRSVATESSRSRIRPSGPEDGPLASLRSESPGTNRKERIGSAFRAFAHERLALALGDDLATLVGGGVVELDDARIDARLAFSRAQHRRAYLERVAVEYRLGEADVGHAEIGNGSTERRVV